MMHTFIKKSGHVVGHSPAVDACRLSASLRSGQGFALLFVMALFTVMISRRVHAADRGESASEISVELRYQRPTEDGFELRTKGETWDAAATAIIVCDMWDLHHSRNAVERAAEFAPRLDEVLTDARGRGVTIIHAPSDCMDFYADHPARRRAMAAPTATTAPPGVGQWCLQLPSETSAVYPIDQFDGGEDDAPDRLAEWAAHLESLGRNPRGPWKRQTDSLTIDPERDFISSHGDEVWNILEANKIDNVILTGVHLNMCVMGRPFGLRQMVRGGKNVALMRDLTDTMYNPASWPYVDHFTGTDLMVAYVERTICPTITSDQWIGGRPFRFRDDTRSDAAILAALTRPVPARDHRQPWGKVSLPPGPNDPHVAAGERAWYRSVVRIPEAWNRSDLLLEIPSSGDSWEAWGNGRRLTASRQDGTVRFALESDAIEFGTGNLLVIRSSDGTRLEAPPVVTAGRERLSLEGTWQFRIGNGEQGLETLSLPAQFAAPADIIFQPADDIR